MTMLNLLERLGGLPAEAWLVPPVVILGTMAVIGLLLHRARLRRFHAIASRAGLSVKATIMNGSEVGGTFRGRALVMALASPRRNTFRKRWTRVIVEVKNPECVSLHLWRQGFLDNLIMAVGGTELQVGDAAFDRRFVVRSDEPALVMQLFQSRELRDAILRAGIDRVDLVTSRLNAFYPREERDPEHAVLLFTAVAHLADGIDALKGDHRPEIIRTDRR
jgi:hypothetical protein